MAAPVAQARPQLNVGITNTFSLVPLWVAQQNGLFEKYGVSVNLLIEQGGPANALPAVLNGNYFAWEGGTDSFMIFCARQPKPCPLVSAAAATNTPDTALFARPTFTYQQPSDLRGKTIGILNKGSLTDYVMSAWLKQNNLVSGQDVQVRSMGGIQATIAALEQGAADAVTITPPQTFAMQAEGMVQLVDFNRDVAPYQTSISIVRRQSVTDERASLVALNKGMYEGLVLARTNKTAALGAAAVYSGISDTTVLGQAYDHTMPLLLDRPYHSVDGVQHVINILESLPKETYDIPFTPETKPQDFYSDQTSQELDSAGFFDQIDKQYGYTQRKNTGT